MERIRIIIRKGLRFYMIYVFIFAILLFALHKPKKKVEVFSNDYYDIETANTDRVALVESGQDGALVRLNFMRNAEKSLDVSYYTLIAGKSTELILGSILDAADRGIEVRILLDGIFHNLKGDLKDTIYGFDSHPNINLKFYEPLKLLSPMSWNNRLHDKIIIVDEKLALIGGRNIGDKYFREDIMEDDFVKDRDVIIFNEFLYDSSSVITDMKNYYDSIWDYEYSKPPIKKIKPKQLVKGEKFNEKLRLNYREFIEEYMGDIKPIDWHKKTIPTESIKFVYNPIGRANQDPWCLRELLRLASKAEKSIFIQSPYIIPSKNMKAKFSEYDIELEKITMLTNSFSSSPNPLAISGYYNNREEIVDSGVKLYEYQGPKSIHSKTYIIDDSISAVGSFNFDARSSYINTESMVIIESEEFTDILKDNIQIDLDNSLIVDSDYSYIDNDNIEEGEVSPFIKIIIKLLSKIVSFLDYLL